MFCLNLMENKIEPQTMNYKSVLISFYTKLVNTPPPIKSKWETCVRISQNFLLKVTNLGNTYK